MVRSAARTTTASPSPERSSQHLDRNVRGDHTVRGDWATSLRRCSDTNDNHAEQKHHAYAHPAQGQSQISIVHHHFTHRIAPRQQASLSRWAIWRQTGGRFSKLAAQILAL